MNTPKYEDELKVAAEGGNIDHLYAVIEQDEFVLDRIDSKPFVQTPLHVAAYAGNLEFAIEVMRLKPSYAYKLNQQGFSPIHLAMQRLQELIINQQGSDLAMQKRQLRMVCRLVETDKDLVRVKGREGITPLHFATQIGDVDLLACFLFYCPDSIGDVNVRGETALHLAVKYNQYDALQVLIGLLTKRTRQHARELERKILNWKDYQSNTILHISVLNNNSQALQLLLKTRIYLNETNLNDLTALDMVATTNVEMKNILSSAGAKPSSKVKVTPTVAQKLKSNVTFIDKILIDMLRIRRVAPEEQRNTYLIGATLVATAIYQTSLSPPGGFYQDNNVSMNTTASQTNIGKSVMSGIDFLFFSFINTFSLLFSTMTIYFLTPISGLEGALLCMPLLLFASGYANNLEFISPTSATSTFNFVMSIGFPFLYVLWISYLGYKRYKGFDYRARWL